MVGITSKYPFVGNVESLIGGRKENQDFFGYVDTPIGLLLVVCDGMGGGPGGRTASTLAVESVLDTIRNCSEKTVPQDALRYSIEKSNDVLYSKASEDPDLRGMGTTIVALLISEEKACIAHIGDSRLYQIRRGKTVFRTADHSVVAEQVRLGTLTEEQARNHPRSNQITRALGIRPQVEIEFDEVTYKTGDRFVLCSDGIWGSMPEPQLVAMFSQRMGLPELTATIADDVNNIGMSNGGGHDNLTIAVLDTTGDSIVKDKRRLISTVKPSAKSRNPIIWIAALVAVIAIAVAAYFLLSKDNADESSPAEPTVKGTTETTIGTHDDIAPQQPEGEEGEGEVNEGNGGEDNAIDISENKRNPSQGDNLHQDARNLEKQVEKQRNHANNRIDEISHLLDSIMNTKKVDDKKKIRGNALEKTKELKALLKYNENKKSEGIDQKVDDICDLINNEITLRPAETGKADKVKGHINHIQKCLMELKQK